MIKNNKGITLIALIVTIIVLLILVGVSVKTLVGNDGIIEKAGWAKFVNNIRALEEAERLEQLDNKMQKYADINELQSISYGEMANGGYAVLDKYEVLEGTLKTSIEELEGDINSIYEVDKEKINMTEIKGEYVIDISCGRVYQIKAHDYMGLIYHTPDKGTKKGEQEVEEDDVDKKNIKIHYLPGYEGGEERIQVVNIDAETVVLAKVPFTNGKNTFVRWKDITSQKISDTEIIDEKDDTHENITEENTENEDIEIIDGLEEITEEIIEETYEEEIIYYEDREEIELQGIDVYLEAEWTQYIVTLEANAGTVSITNWPVIDGEKYGELPDPERSGYVFGGWYTDNGTFSNQIVGDDIYSVSSGVTTLYAYWEEETSSNIATVTYDATAKGGTCTKISKQVVKGKKIGNLPTKKQTKKATYNFDCWTLSDFDTKVTKNYIVTDNITIYARFTIHMNFDYQGGTVNKRYRKTPRKYKNVKIGGKRGNIYTYAIKSNCKGNGWWTKPNGEGEKTTNNTKIEQTEDFTIYACWLEKCTIEFNLNYETQEVPPTTKKIYSRSKYGKLSTVKREGYKFKGWYTDPIEGVQITEADIVNKSIVLYAHWEIDLVKKINTIEDLEEISKDLTASYEMMRDLDFNNRDSYRTDERYQYYTTLNSSGVKTNSWTSIGTTKTTPFSGNFDGHNYTLSNLYINSTVQYTGLFGFFTNGNIKNIILENVNITSTNSATGGLVGCIGSGVIENISVSGTISGKATTGGICGNANLAEKVIRCKNTAIINGSTNVGGISGVGKYIYESANYADVTASGGFVGGIVGNGSYIEKCYNKGIIKGKGKASGDSYTSAGGIIGAGTKVMYCYNRGNVAGSSGQVGGISGNSYQRGSKIVQYCYNTGTISGTRAGSIIGQCDGASIANCWFTSTKAARGNSGSQANCARVTEDVLKGYADKLGEFFTDDKDGINDGFPILKFQIES